jgi:spermidine synthase
MTVSKSSNFILEFTVFVCGALVMIYEIIGSRLLSPYIGTSTYVWTSLIGVILAALSLGYWLGGKSADRNPDLKILAAVIFGAGGLVSVTILLKDVILAFIAQMPFGLEIKSVVAAILLFAPASVLLGFVTPYAVKLKMAKFEDAGKTVGRLYALSTVGSIFGTFAAGFLLIPFVGSVRTLYLIGATLIGLSILLAPFALTRINVAILLMFVFGIATSETLMFAQYKISDLHDIDTEYSRIQVFKTTDTRTGKPIRAIATDPFFIQSAMYLDSDELALKYAPYYHLIAHFKPDFRKTLLIGGAGYTFPRDYLKKYSNAEIEVVEIDQQMTAIAKKFFKLEENPRLKITHEDGRIFLNNAPDKQYDAVLMDAFGTLFSVPYHLTTREAVEQISRTLNDDGVIIFNLGGAIEGDGSGFLKAELATYKSVFPKVYLFKVNPDYSNNQFQNLIIVAAKEKNSATLTSENPNFSKLLANLYQPNINLDKKILTDDLAPVEYYNSFAQSVYSFSK